MFTVKYGSLLLSTGNEVNVSSIVRHPHHNYGSDDYDIAILRLASTFASSENAKVIPLATTMPAVGSSVVVTGWGWLNLTSVGPSEELQQADTLHVITFEECEDYWGAGGYAFTMTDRLLCTYSEQQSALPGKVTIWVQTFKTNPEFKSKHFFLFFRRLWWSNGV